MRARNLIESFVFALEGLVFCLKSQRNIVIHFFLGTVALALGLVWQVDRWELLILLLTITGVISSEMLNTALEEVVNLVTTDYHPLARTAKNAAAAAVLIWALCAVIVAYFIFFPRFLVLF